MLSLAFEEKLRQLFSVPAHRAATKSSPCLWSRSKKSIDTTLRALTSDPRSACEDLNLKGPERIWLVDELLAHAKFSAAMNLAGFLASDVVQYRSDRTAVNLGAAAFLRTKEAQASIEGGLVDRAAPHLLQLSVLCEGLDAASLGTKLLKANLLLLRGRLLQLLWLPERSAEFVGRTERALIETMGEVPPGFALWRLRSELLRNPHSTRTQLLKLTNDCVNSPSNLFGSFAEHYRDYLCARVAIETKQWKRAVASLDEAEQSLRAHGHAGQPDPVRLAFTTLARGRAIVELGLSRENPEQTAEGMELLVLARTQFRGEQFWTGLYLAQRHYGHARARQEEIGDELKFRLLRDAYELAVRTRVMKFQVQSGVEYAGALYKYGRLNKAKPVVEAIYRLREEPESGEVIESAEWADVDALVERTKDAKVNAVEPRQRWGVSPYAQRELEFIEKVLASGACVSIYGSKGAGRRTLVQRVIDARGQTGTLTLVDGVGRPPTSIEREIKSIPKKDLVLLQNLDQWSLATQAEALRALQHRGNDWPTKTYITLRTQLSACGDLLIPGFRGGLYSGTFNTEPLEGRPQDILLLARGFLIRALMARRDHCRDVGFPDLFFSSEACRQIRRGYTRVGDLQRHMKSLAHQLSLFRDVEIDRGERMRISLEVLNRYLGQQAPSAEKEPVPSGDRQDRLHLGRDILSADERMVQTLARQYGGRLAAVAKENSVPLSTLRLTWKKRGMLDAWRAGGGKRTNLQEIARTGPNS